MHFKPTAVVLLPVMTLVTALTLAAAEQEAAKPFLPGVQRIVFLGDSITYDGRYVSYFELEWLLHLRERPVEILSCGLPSETVSGLSEEGHAGGKFPRPTLHERLDRVLAKTKPDLVLACYGMNDGIYLPADEQRFGFFKEGMQLLHKKVEDAGAKIIHLTPPVFDPEPIGDRVVSEKKVPAGKFFRDYDDVLAQYSAWLVNKGKDGWRVIDLHSAMKEALAKERESKPGYTFAADGVHPNQRGHFVLGRALVRGLEAPFDTEANQYGDVNDPASFRAKLIKLVHEKRRILTDAWLTDIGHKRPMRPGLPLDEAKKKAAAVDTKIGKLLNE